MKKTFRFLFALSIVLAIILFCCYRFVAFSAKPYLYNVAADAPKNKVGLLLGTSKELGNGRLNPFFKNRIDPTVALYKAEKIIYILLAVITVWLVITNRKI